MMILDAYDDGIVHWHMWCTFCHVWHRHGRTEGAEIGYIEPGEWVPHCAYSMSRDPSAPKGYTGRLVGMWTEDVRAAYASEERRGWKALERWKDLGGERGAVTFADVWAEEEGREAARQERDGMRARGR